MMRSSRRGGHGGLEFGGSGEDSFVAVVVTKLTGALLFILLLTMVIMALIPKAVDLPAGEDRGPTPDARPLAIATPETLPEAIAGHPYAVALAATGGKGEIRWSLDGSLPAGLSFDPSTGLIRGTPRAGTAEPAALVLRVGDGDEQVSRPARLVVYQSDKPLTTPAWWKPGIPPLPWRAWLEHGFGFLVLWLVYLVSMNALAGLRREGLDDVGTEAEDDLRRVRRRFAAYRAFVRLVTLGAAAVLAVWLWRQHV
jgi:hypothetical protein